jgi:hypothetical protein
MKLCRALAVALLAACAPLAAFAGTVTVNNTDGTFTTNTAQNTLSLTGAGASQLGQVMMLGPGYDCGSSGTPVCSGKVTLLAGPIMSGGSGSTLTPLTGKSTWLGGGGSTFFDVTENAGGGLNGFTFSGAFSTTPGANTWSCTGTCVANKNSHGVVTSWTGTWVFSGTVTNGILTIGGQTFMESAATVQLTTINGTVTNPGAGKSLTFTDSGGHSTFPSPVPEPSTLSLLGCGLIAVGVLTKRFAARA